LSAFRGRTVNREPAQEKSTTTSLEMDTIDAEKYLRKRLKKQGVSGGEIEAWAERFKVVRRSGTCVADWRDPCKALMVSIQFTLAHRHSDVHGWNAGLGGFRENYVANLVVTRAAEV